MCRPAAADFSSRWGRSSIGRPVRRVGQASAAQCLRSAVLNVSVSGRSREPKMEIRCPHCEKLLTKNGEQYVGRTVKCGGCQRPFKVEAQLRSPPALRVRPIQGPTRQRSAA